MALPIAEWITRAIVFLVAMVVHEFAHGYIAYQNGDPTAKEQGKMTLDPRANLNPIGYLAGILIGFGFLGSAPISPGRMRNPRWGTFQAVLAGPLSNLLLAAIFAVPFRFGVIRPTDVAGEVIPSTAYVLTQMVFLNVLLFVFNLIPLFPLDGWTIVLAALPAGPAVWWHRNQQASMYLFYGLIALSFIAPNLGPLALFNPLSWAVGLPTSLISIGLMGR